MIQGGRCEITRHIEAELQSTGTIKIIDTPGHVDINIKVFKQTTDHKRRRANGLCVVSEFITRIRGLWECISSTTSNHKT